MNRTNEARMRCEPAATQREREHGSRGIPIVGSCYRATPTEDMEAIKFAVVIDKMCRLEIVL
jgi:hypothetical protein